jgi:hypothetical protein
MVQCAVNSSFIAESDLRRNGFPGGLVIPKRVLCPVTLPAAVLTQKPGMNDVLLVSGIRQTIQKYAVLGSPPRHSDALPSWLIMVWFVFLTDRTKFVISTSTMIKLAFGKLYYTEGGGIKLLRNVVVTSQHLLMFQKLDFSPVPLWEHQILRW